MIWVMVIITLTSLGEVATAVTVPYGSLAACEAELPAVQRRLHCELFPARWSGRPVINEEAIKREKEAKARAKAEAEAKRRDEAEREKQEAERFRRDEQNSKTRWPWRLVTSSGYITFYPSKLDCEKATLRYEGAICEKRP